MKLYSLKDYREIKKNFDFIKGIEKGGLGPYIKDGKWNERKMLVEKMLKFSHDVKVINTAKITKYYEDSMSKQTSLYQYKKDLDLSARQKGWEFANNIEIPKINKKKNNQFDTILEKEDLEDTLEFYEKRHKELSKKIEKNKSK